MHTRAHSVSLSLFPETERQSLDPLAPLACTNPFGPEFVEMERSILGAHHVPQAPVRSLEAGDSAPNWRAPARQFGRVRRKLLTARGLQPADGMDARLLLYRALAVATVLASAPAAAQEAEPKPRPQHFGFRVGVFDNAADVFELGGLGLDAGVDTFYGAFNYRYSLSPTVDLALQAGHWIGQWTTATPRTVELASGFIGPGVRVNGPGRASGQRVVPYLQTNLYFIQEQFYFEQMWSERVTENGLGLGFMGGLEVVVSQRISIPIEAIYLATTGNAGIDDLSGFGVSIGVDFTF